MSTVEAVADGAGGEQSPAPSRHEPRATIALVLAIVSCCTFTIIPALIAFPLAGIGERRIWASNGRLVGSNRVLWARRLSKIGIGLGIAGITVLIVVTQWDGLKNVQQTFFSGHALLDSFPTVRTGFWINVQIFMIAEVLVLIWALLLAVFRSLPGRAAAPLRWFAIGYIDLFRGLPAIVTIYMIGYGISLANLPIAKNLHDFQFGILALTIVYGAYVAEVYRAGIESVHWSQVAAARSLGLSYGQSMQYVIAPQAIRRIIPPLAQRLHRPPEGHRAARIARNVGRLQARADLRQQPLDAHLGHHPRPALPRDHDSARAIHRLPAQARAAPDPGRT